jgi:hypothetical protein
VDALDVTAFARFTGRDNFSVVGVCGCEVGDPLHVICDRMVRIEPGSTGGSAGCEALAESHILQLGSHTSSSAYFSICAERLLICDGQAEVLVHDLCLDSLSERFEVLDLRWRNHHVDNFAS